MNTLFSDQNKKILLSIEGNIGAGKSTFLKKLKENFFDAEVIFEPHNEWQNIKGFNLLDNFYKDTARWAYSFQNYAFLTRSRAIENAINLKVEKDLFFAERSVYADYYTFAKALNLSNLMNDLEWDMYKNWHGWISEKYIKKPDAFLYLKVSPETSYKRIKSRNRSEEEGIGLDYLKKLHDFHEDWLIKKNCEEKFCKNIPVLVLNGEIDFEKNNSDLNYLITEIRNFLNEKFLIKNIKNEENKINTDLNY